MSIKKIINPEEFAKVWDELEIYFREENKTYGHRYLPISKQSVIDSWGHTALLNNTMHVWANLEDGKARGVIMFLEYMNTTFGEKMFTEYFWISNDSRKSFSLLKQLYPLPKGRALNM